MERDDDGNGDGFQPPQPPAQPSTQPPHGAINSNSGSAVNAPVSMLDEQSLLAMDPEVSFRPNMHHTTSPRHMKQTRIYLITPNHNRAFEATC